MPPTALAEGEAVGTWHTSVGTSATRAGTTWSGGSAPTGRFSSTYTLMANSEVGTPPVSLSPIVTWTTPGSADSRSRAPPARTCSTRAFSAASSSSVLGIAAPDPDRCSAADGVQQLSRGVVSGEGGQHQVVVTLDVRAQFGAAVLYQGVPQPGQRVRAGDARDLVREPVGRVPGAAGECREPGRALRAVPGDGDAPVVVDERGHFGLVCLDPAGQPAAGWQGPEVRQLLGEQRGLGAGDGDVQGGEHVGDVVGVAVRVVRVAREVQPDDLAVLVNDHRTRVSRPGERAGVALYVDLVGERVGLAVQIDGQGGEAGGDDPSRRAVAGPADLEDRLTADRGRGARDRVRPADGEFPDDVVEADAAVAATGIAGVDACDRAVDLCVHLVVGNLRDRVLHADRAFRIPVVHRVLGDLRVRLENALAVGRAVRGSDMTGGQQDGLAVGDVGGETAERARLVLDLGVVGAQHLDAVRDLYAAGQPAVTEGVGREPNPRDLADIGAHTGNRRRHGFVRPGGQFPLRVDVGLDAQLVGGAAADLLQPGRDMVDAGHGEQPVPRTPGEHSLDSPILR